MRFCLKHKPNYNSEKWEKESWTCLFMLVWGQWSSKCTKMVGYIMPHSQTSFVEHTSIKYQSERSRKTEANRFNIPVSWAFSVLLTPFLNSLHVTQVVVSPLPLYSIDPLSSLVVLLFFHIAFQL